MIKYGLISEIDGKTLEKTVDLIIEESNFLPIRITEIGLFDCGTAKGIYEYLQEEKNLLDNDIIYTGIDCEKDKLIHPPNWMNFIRGNSNEVYNQIPDNSQHLIFVDGCHCFSHVVSDFFCYAPKVKVGGYFAFHDTGKHIKEFKDFQHGDKTNPDAYISCRKALASIGMFDDAGYDLHLDGTLSPRYMGNHGFRIILDEADSENEAGGIIVFKKKKPY